MSSRGAKQSILKNLQKRIIGTSRRLVKERNTAFFLTSRAGNACQMVSELREQGGVLDPYFHGRI